MIAFLVFPNLAQKLKFKPRVLVIMFQFFRHGTRSPLYKPYPTDPNQSKYQDHLPGPPGELTQAGKKLMYGVGKKLKTMYGKFIGPYSEEKVHVTSTNMARTIMSAQSAMAGMFPPEKKIFDSLFWQPIPVWHDTEEFDKAYIFNDPDYPKLALQDCPKYGALIKKGYDISLAPDTNADHKPIYELLQKNTGRTDINSIDKHYEIWDTLEFESLNGLPLPTWATEPQPNFNNKPLYPDLMSPLLVDLFEKSIYLDKNKEMLSFYTGPLFNSIHERFLKKAEGIDKYEVFRFHATHDDTLCALLWGLGLNEPMTIGPGEGIIFELHREHSASDKPGEHFVKVLYCHSTQDYKIQEFALPCSQPTTLNKFIEAYPGITPHQWQEKCKSLTE